MHYRYAERYARPDQSYALSYAPEVSCIAPAHQCSILHTSYKHECSRPACILIFPPAADRARILGAGKDKSTDSPTAPTLRARRQQQQVCMRGMSADKFADKSPLGVFRLGISWHALKSAYG